MEQTANRRGQLLIGVIIMMIVLAIMIPAMVSYLQNEARWTLKEDRSVHAFQLAEAGIDKAFRKISESTATWQSIQDAVFPGVLGGYFYELSHRDVKGGCYALYLSSGPNAGEATVYSVGYEPGGKEARAIKAVFANAVTDIAVHSNGALAITGNGFQLEWGAAISPKAITIGNRSYPQYYSASSIDKDANGSAQPNCDANCMWWWSFYQDIPAQPDIDFDFYRSSAQGVVLGGGETVDTGACVASPPGSTYFPATCATVELGNVTTQKGRTIFIEGNANINSSGGNHYVVGNFVVMGNFTTSNGNIGTGTETIPVPRTAWKQYGNAWDGTPTANYYRARFDPTAPAAFPGLNSSYLSSPTLTYTINGKVFVHGFLYIGGNFSTGSGGGNFALVGTAIVNGATTINTNSAGTLYYNADVAQQVKNTNVTLKRVSWQDYPKHAWPAGLTCL